VSCIAERFQRARRDQSLAVLEGFHPLKHAVRFGADLLEVVTADAEAVLDLALALAPDITDVLKSSMVSVTADVFARLVPDPLPTPVVAIARRPQALPEEVLADPSQTPVVFLDKPNHLGNIGAVVRVAAAAGAAGVLTSGDRDPWHPTALRGSNGLHFALPVARVGTLPATHRPVVAIVPGGSPLGTVPIPARSVICLGGERHGLDPELVAAADLRMGIPMRPGVSSLNLATAAAVVLYSLPRPPQ
jgi:TrmH family RNA methyltransferase